ncbi:MAG: U32 family peptidase [Oscillospiraceae bacterium]
MRNKQLPELLAPAGGMESLIAAVRCGADAVYIGAKQFSARHSAENFTADSLREAVTLCHTAGVRLYLAVNTLLTAQEFAQLDLLALQVAELGIDGCIVQDYGVVSYLRARVPQLPVHASTQMTIHTAQGIAAAKEMGLCRVVLARECAAKRIADLTNIAHQMNMETEVFVHGAHCMSVSGQCWLSAAMGGRSANRGRCAQPCRLPFTANTDACACALSLKDMSLIDHVQRLTAMGVDSIKIEGRMKRPEYVAATVRAYRQALEGSQPDMEALQAVFSRSGFTDGYFTDRRVKMFGVRRKEDVLAANMVLASLRETYRKPRKIATLHGHFTLQSGQPAALTVHDGMGHSATVSGAVPQMAHNRPGNTESLRRQLEKLGDTIYDCGTVTADIGEGLMLPAAAVNAMRRDAVAALDSARCTAATPQYTVSTPPQPLTVSCNTAQPRLWLSIRKLSQLDKLHDVASSIHRLLLPLQFAQTYAEQPLLPLAQCILLPPRWCNDETKIRAMLCDAKSLGFMHLACGNVGDVPLGRALALTLHGTLGYHITNRFAADMASDMGLADGLLSPELPPQNAAQIGGALPLGIYAYGRLPLMLMRNCPIQAQIGCKQCNHQLTDRKGQLLYTDCTRITQSPDYAELFNSATVWLADRQNLCQGAAYQLLAMTDESPQRVQEVVRAYTGAANITPPARFTRGLHLADASEHERNRQG